VIEEIIEHKSENGSTENEDKQNENEVPKEETQPMNDVINPHPVEVVEQPLKEEIKLREHKNDENSNQSEEVPVKRISLFKIIKIEQKSRSNTDESLLSLDLPPAENKRRSLADLIDEKLKDNNEILVEPSVEEPPIEYYDEPEAHSSIHTYDERKTEKERLIPRLKKKISFKFAGKKTTIQKREEAICSYDSEDNYENYGPHLNVDNDQLNENFEGVAFFEAVKEGMDMIVQTLLETSNNHQLNMTDDEGFTPVMQAAWHGQDDCLQILLDHCADTSLQNVTGCTAAHFAAGQGNTRCLEILAKDQLVDINCQTKFGATPLILASKGGHIDCLKLLLNHGADPNIQYRGNQNALLFAAGNGHYECIELLIEHQVNLDQANTQNVTPLMRAVQQAHNDCVMLLSDKGADLNVQDTYGRTAAHLAVENHNPKALQILVNAGADLNLTTKGGNTPLAYCERFKEGLCLDILEKHNEKNNIKQPIEDKIIDVNVKECTLYPEKEKTVKCMKFRNIFRRSKRHRSKQQHRT